MLPFLTLQSPARPQLVLVYPKRSAVTATKRKQQVPARLGAPLSLSHTKTPTQNPTPLTSAAISSRPFQPQHCNHGQVRRRGQAGHPRGCDLAKGRTPIPQGHQGVPRGLGPVPARQGAHHRLASKVQPAMAHQRRHRRPHAGSDVDPPGSGLRQDCRDPRRVRVDVVVAAGEHLCHYGNHKG